MKSLSLYVDKWFISVAVNIDGNVMPLSLPNGEDRIWLFFHEDIPNSKIEYGKAFENDYRDKRPHFIGDVFALIAEGDHYFTRYEKRREEMKEIFNVSGIFNHLRQAIDVDEGIDTYISFSADISYVARLRFIEELKEHNFNVAESVARISQLALEECRQRQVFYGAGNYLVLAATNENFHYSLYENNGYLFLRKNEGVLHGLGLDMRRRALVETIVENINQNSRLLQSREEIDNECLRQDRFATQWIDQIAKSKPYKPVALDGITFAVAPNNPYVVQIIPSILDERTSGLVDDLVRKIADFVKNNQLQPHEIEGIVFVGNTFTNQIFAKAIKNKFIIQDEKIVLYCEDELPKIVNVYSQIDCGQFKGATHQFFEDAKTQELLLVQAKEEAEKNRKAEEEILRQQALIESQKKADLEYRNAVENIERYESEHNYQEMLEWAEIALKNRPDDENAKVKIDLARQLLAEQQAAIKNFNTILQRAKTAFSEERWSDVISQCGMALEIKPDSEIASRLKKDARRRMDINDKIQNLLNRANMFFAQKLYSEALKELEKINNLDPSNEEAKEIKEKILEVYAEQKQKIDKLAQSLSDAEKKKDFQEAIQLCRVLIKEDSANLSKWTSRKERIISAQRDFEENKRKLNELRKEINTAHFNEDWIRLNLLCENYLSIEFDQEVSRFFSKSKKRMLDLKEKEERDKALASINGLIIDGRINDAEKELDGFAQKYPSEQLTVKDLRKIIFRFDSNFLSKFTSIKETSRIESKYQPNVGIEKDFFNNSGESRLKHKVTNKKKTCIDNKGSTDLFDGSEKTGKKIASSKLKSIDTDFNF